MLKIDDVKEGDELGVFRANAECLGWRRADGDRKVVHPTPSVKRAEWRDGCLRVQCQDGEGEDTVFGLEGIPAARFDDLWRFFEKNCNVYIKKHKADTKISSEDFDAAMRSVSAAADKIDDAAVGSVSKRAGEADLMKRVEVLRDGLNLAVSGDKQALSDVFSENGCERIGRLRLVVDTVHLEVYQADHRWLHLRNLASTVESILKELGRFKVWRPLDDSGDDSMQRRQMVRELQQRSGYDGTEDEDEEELGAGAVSNPLSAAPNPLSGGPGKLKRDDLLMPVLAGLLPPSSSSARPPYRAPPVEETPAPVEEPEPLVEDKPSDGGPEEDWDVEVDNPNEVQAAAPDAKLRGGKVADGGKIRYIYPNSVLEGWVWKRSQYLKKWRRRWLVLQPDHLATYKQRSVGGQTERVEKGSVQTAQKADNEVMQTKAFCVTAAVKRTLGVRTSKLFMVCDTEKLRDTWVAAIQETLGNHRR